MFIEEEEETQGFRRIQFKSRQKKTDWRFKRILDNLEKIIITIIIIIIIIIIHSLELFTSAIADGWQQVFSSLQDSS